MAPIQRNLQLQHKIPAEVDEFFELAIEDVFFLHWVYLLKLRTNNFSTPKGRIGNLGFICFVGSLNIWHRRLMCHHPTGRVIRRGTPAKNEEYKFFRPFSIRHSYTFLSLSLIHIQGSASPSCVGILRISSNFYVRRLIPFCMLDFCYLFSAFWVWWFVRASNQNWLS